MTADEIIHLPCVTRITSNEDGKVEFAVDPDAEYPSLFMNNGSVELRQFVTWNQLEQLHKHLTEVLEKKPKTL
jgi:hypothetical protein